MENQSKTEIYFKDITQLLWQKRKKIILCSIIGIVVGIIVGFSIPKTYVSQVKIAAESSSNDNTPDLGKLAAMSGVNLTNGKSTGITEKVYPEIIKSPEFLGEFSRLEVTYDGEKIPLNDYLLQKQKRPWWSYVMGAPEKFISWLFSSPKSNDIKTPANDSRNSKLNPSDEQRGFEGSLAGCFLIEKKADTGIYTFQVKMQDPLIAAQVADTAINILQRYMTEYYTSKVRNKLVSSVAMLAVAKQDYFYADSIYASSVDKNQNLISRTAQIKLERLENERNIALSVYKQLANQVANYNIQILEESPIATVIETARMPQFPAAPNKKLIVIGFLVAFTFVPAGFFAVKYIFNKNK